LLYYSSFIKIPVRFVYIVIEPFRQRYYKRKGIDALALGGAAENLKSKNYHRVFKDITSDVPRLVFCTPEYLFGTPTIASSSGSAGQFHSLKAI